MRTDNGLSRARRVLALGAALAMTLALPTAANAQQGGSNALTESLKTLERSPRDVDALVTAGEETLEIGDIPSAAAFFGRAAEASPEDPRVLAGLGALAAYMNQPDKALTYYSQASSQGGRDADLGAGRGLAFDLVGNRGAAETNYRAALQGRQGDVAARRLALNLAMAGDRTAAMALLGPQVRAGSPAALRARAFVLALTGDPDNARRAIEAAMPGSGDAVDPFLRLLPRLSDRQKAAAVHLGIFPTENEVELASATPRAPAAPQASTQVAARGATTRPTQRGAERIATASRNSERDRLIEAVGESRVPENTPEQRVRRGGSRYVSDAQLRAGRTVRRAVEPDPVRREAQERSTPIETQRAPVRDSTSDRLADLENSLTQRRATPVETPARVASVAIPAAPTPKYDAPPPPRPKYDAPPPPTPKVQAAPAPTPVVTARAPDVGVDGQYFVQLAGSDDRGAMSYEWRRIARRANGSLEGRDPLLTRGVDFHRLLVGPFDTRGQAQALVNRLKGEGVDSFAWTRNPSALRIDKL